MSSAPPKDTRTFDDLLREKKEKDPGWERNDACYAGDTSGLMDDSSHPLPGKKNKESPAN